MNETKHLIHFDGSAQGTSPGFTTLLDRRGLCRWMLCGASLLVANKQPVNDSRLAGGSAHAAH
jgi:hypothetical protein